MKSYPYRLNPDSPQLNQSKTLYPYSRDHDGS
ncbi:Uncharacterised protein [Mycobacteroides abscessus subsp. abscessus]|nr:Uncharacterised protein [Mycobacteroides abscessus subsp. abscessus]